MNRAMVADYLGISTRTLDRWVALGMGPPVSRKVGNKRWRIQDVARWASGDLQETRKGKR